MENQQLDEDLDTRLTALRQINPYSGLSSDAEFLQKLNQKLSLLERAQSPPLARRIWFNGVCNGLAAAALGVIIFISLQLLPHLLISASLAGTELIKGKIIETAINQNVLWQKIIINLRQFI